MMADESQERRAVRLALKYNRESSMRRRLLHSSRSGSLRARDAGNLRGAGVLSWMEGVAMTRFERQLIDDLTAISGLHSKIVDFALFNGFTLAADQSLGTSYTT